MLSQGVLSVGFDSSEEHFCNQGFGKLPSIRSCKTRYGLDLRKRDCLFPAAKCEYPCLFVGELYAEACLKKNLLIRQKFFPSQDEFKALMSLDVGNSGWNVA